MRKIIIISFILLAFFCLFAEDSQPIASAPEIKTIDFSGGYSKVKRVGNIDTVTLSNNAIVNTQSISVEADEIEISGENYSLIRCKGNVRAIENENNIVLNTPELFYNRIDDTLLINSWVEIEDTENEIEMSGAYLEFKIKEELFNLQIDAMINKATDKGQLIGKAQSIVYNNKTRTIVLQGEASVIWATDDYKASVIRINLDTEEIVLEGQISGTVNG